ncbi:biotin-independent malonate decarboxylase subunit gamma [Methylobacterium sp. J-077]|uniref:biotin-independent malonate decarboxylase subunit gamma n=1 Tax=Methylobacterium sp. J-077 TaxID=2836656 RepID=UPI001FB8A072|nr:biotin-independent malonate decarboxylase subunit gamma [Methylobacterium sp. J-077]MCJ2126299.1 biotin-independent malonate decarboxylase subunit gamma [Methylobacterium sp. J-077]
MTLAEILAGVFPQGHSVTVRDGLVTGGCPFAGDKTLHVVGVDGDTPLGVDGALVLSRAVLDAVRAGDKAPILVVVDSDSQRMSRRDELLGLNECLAHLAKALLLADRSGHPTIGLIYGHSAAGAFIATALATRVLAALPGANPSVMDLPSVARVTKLPLDKLQEMAKSTPVFAPGLDNMVATGAVHVVLDPAKPLDGQIRDLIADLQPGDDRDRLGEERGGRPVARGIGEAVIAHAGRL